MKVCPGGCFDGPDPRDQCLLKNDVISIMSARQGPNPYLWGVKYLPDTSVWPPTGDFEFEIIIDNMGGE